MATKYGSLPFKEAIDFFRSKLNIPTERYNDLQREAHDIGFMVAGAQQADLLNDLRQAVDKAIAQGSSLGTFRKDFEAIVAKRGWTGWAGEDSKEGRAWRTRVIYDTNLRQAYAAGRERQMSTPEFVKARPYGLYRHSGNKHAREEHKAWDNKVVPLNDPWWDTHTPQNGYFCGCAKFALSEKEVKRRGLEISQGTDMPFQGQGIDEGFDYRPGGDEVRRFYQQLRQKAERYPPALKQRFLNWLNQAEQMPAIFKNLQRPLDPDLLQDVPMLNKVVDYAKAIENPMILETIQLGGLLGSAVLVHEIKEIIALESDNIDPLQGISLIIERYGLGQQAATASELREHVLFHLIALKAEVEYVQKRLKAQGIKASLAEIANALYRLQDNNPYAERTIYEFNALGIHINTNMPYRQDILDAL